jgi:hypothetical protein
LKKLLIIQLDEPYFLFETALMLQRYREALKDFELTLFVDTESFKQIQDGSCTFPQNTTSNIKDISGKNFDLSVNLSLKETSWEIHKDVNSEKKIGSFNHDGLLHVPDQWSSYLLTLKAKAPFLTFHLQDIYKNILGIRKISTPKKNKKTYQQLVFSLCHTSFFSPSEQERFIQNIHQKYPHLSIVDIAEIDPVSDLSHVLYIGPTCLDALKICEDGATGIFLSGKFQGFNLIPHDEGHYFLSSKRQYFMADDLIRFIDAELVQREITGNFPFAIYVTEEENLFGSFLKSINTSDENYPIYQSHVVLWNYLLNLFDIGLEITSCSIEQMEVLRNQKEVLQKLIRLYDYAMSSIDTIHSEARAVSANAESIQGHLKNLQDIEQISDKIAQTHMYLRPVIDFYRIRRGQNTGTTLLEQTQHTFLTYSEEHQALRALLELFTVTLAKNEVSI